MTATTDNAMVVEVPGSSDAPAPPRAGLDALMIQRATHDHVPYLRRLKDLIMSERYRPASTPEDLEAWREMYCTDEYFHRMIDDPRSLLLCIGTLREPVGMVVMHRRGEHLEIDDLLVLHPRMGEGRRLLVSCLRYAEVWRESRVVIDVYPGNTDVERFLEAHGFTRAGESSNDLGRPMHRYAVDRT